MPDVAKPLEMKVETGPLNRLVEADVRISNAKRKPGESAGAWGSRLKGNDRRIAAKDKAKKKNRSGGDAEFEKQHPRGRGGSWILKSGSSGSDVKAIQKKVGAKTDGKFGAKTAAAVRAFQKRKGLKVDGIVGRQTIAAMRGDKDAAKVKPGAASSKDRDWMKKKTRETPAPVGALALRLGDDLRVIEKPEDKGRICEEADLALVETVQDVSALMDLGLLEAALAADANVKFNADGTVDLVIIRPCNGRGVGNRIYEAGMLQQNAGIFSGWPMYDNHESEAAKRARRGLPRPPSELAGEVRESWWDPAFTTPDDAKMGFGQGAVIGRCMLTEDMEKLVRRLPRAVKTSINGEATDMRVGTRNGKRGMVVEGFVNDPENSSVDLVTKAGAGGAVASLFQKLAA